MLVVLLVVRGLPSTLAAPTGVDRGGARRRSALLGATGLPIIVAVTAIGVDEEILTTANAALLVGAGMLSVLLFPLIAMTLRGERSTSRRAAPLEDDLRVSSSPRCFDDAPQPALR